MFPKMFVNELFGVNATVTLKLPYKRAQMSTLTDCLDDALGAKRGLSITKLQLKSASATLQSNVIPDMNN